MGKPAERSGCDPGRRLLRSSGTAAGGGAGGSSGTACANCTTVQPVTADVMHALGRDVSCELRDEVGDGEELQAFAEAFDELDYLLFFF